MYGRPPELPFLLLTPRGLAWGHDGDGDGSSGDGDDGKNGMDGVRDTRREGSKMTSMPPQVSSDNDDDDDDDDDESTNRGLRR